MPDPSLIEQLTASVNAQINTLAGEERAAAQRAWQQTRTAVRQLQAWGTNENTQIAAILHNSVCLGWLDRTLVDAWIAPPRVDDALTLCADYAQIVLAADTGSRGRTRARRRMRYFWAAYHSRDLALLATALLWVQVHAHAAEAGHVGAAAREDARTILSPLLDMLGMQELREALHQTFWPVEMEPAIAASLATLAAEVCHTLQTLIPHAQCERRFPCREGPPAVRQPGSRLPLSVDIALCVPGVEDCYRALYHIHQQFAVVEGSFVDSLRLGRFNGSRALHTAVLVPGAADRVRVNFQIYARAMAAQNRWGLAAGLDAAPEAADAGNDDLQAARLVAPAPELPAPAWWQQAAQGLAQIESAPPGTLPETLYVFSPQGQLFRFHRGCTVVDFAYHVHTDLADQCRRFYINDEPVEPNAVLHHLDIVALEHDAQAPGPTQVWLNAAHTARARNAIERYLNRRGRGLDQGRRLLDERRRHLEQHYGFNLPEHRLAQALTGSLRTLRLSRPEELLDELAAGRLAADQILHPLFADELARQIHLPRNVRLRPHQLQISQCCRPRPGEDIVGLVSRRHDQISRLRVHRADCVRIHPGHEQLPITWRFQPRLTVSEQLEMTAHDEDELLGDAVKQVYARLPHVLLHKVEAAARHGVARLRFHLEAESQEVLDELSAALYALPERQIVDVRRLHLPPSEIEMAESMNNRAAYNPYSRLPVNEQAMFFGRTRELEQILAWLRGGGGNIWLLGQKRVGKTSLLFHLKHHFLLEWGYMAAFVDFQLLGNLASGNLCYEVAAAIFADLQGDPRLGESGEPLSAPLRTLFDLQPAVELIAYLRALNSRIQGAAGRTRLVVLLDEFSRTSDAYLQGQIDRSFFELWRGVMQATAPEVSYITVVQQQTYNTMSRRAQQNLNDPSWHIMELGEKLVLRPLDSGAVRRLIEWPMRNFVEFSPESVAYVAALTGGNPFLIQAFCFKLAAHMAYQERRRVERADIEAVRMEFMLPTESVFAHFLDMLRGIGTQVCETLATLAEIQIAGQTPGRSAAWVASPHDMAGQDVTGHEVTALPSADPPASGAQPAHAPQAQTAVAWAMLAAALPGLPEPVVRRALQELVSCDILIEVAPDAWAFSSRLFQQWLALNAE